MVGDTITTTGFGTTGYNVTNQTVTAATLFSVTIANTTTGSSTTGMIQHVSAWSPDMPQPGAGGRITVTGASPPSFDCSKCSVVSATPTSITYNCTSACSGPATGGTIQEVWGGDWSGMQGLQTVPANQSIETGSQVFIQASTSTTRPFVAYYAGGGPSCGVNFTYQFGTVTNPAHGCWANTGLIVGDGPSTQFKLTVGDDSGSPYLYNNTSVGALTIGAGAADGWNFLSTGDLCPSVGTGAQTIGGSNALKNVASDTYTLASSQLFASGTISVSGMGTASVAGNGTAAIVVTVGTGTISSTETLNMSVAPSAHAWVCTANDRSNGALTGHETASVLASVTITGSAAPASGDVLQHQCVAW